MNPKADFESADAARRAAMVAADAAKLADYLTEDLTWTHSSGRTDDRQAVLDTIAGGAVRYLSLDAADVQVRTVGDVVIATGKVAGRVTKDGAERDLKNRFLSVWRYEADALRMMAWQSTGL
jgi:ketosteroid isomerase-like protein